MTDTTTNPTGKAAPWRGRKRVKDARNHFTAVRCNDEEYAAISKAAKDAGLTVSGYFRAQALGKPGPRAVRRPTVEHEELSRILGQLGKIGSNVNQLAKAYNGGRIVPGFPEVLALRRDVAEVRAAVIKALGYGD
jgi:hypothetical protein